MNYLEHTNYIQVDGILDLHTTRFGPAQQTLLETLMSMVSPQTPTQNIFVSVDPGITDPSCTYLAYSLSQIHNARVVATAMPLIIANRDGQDRANTLFTADYIAKANRAYIRNEEGTYVNRQAQLQSAMVQYAREQVANDATLADQLGTVDTDTFDRADAPILDLISNIEFLNMAYINEDGTLDRMSVAEGMENTVDGMSVAPSMVNSRTSTQAMSVANTQAPSQAASVAQSQAPSQAASVADTQGPSIRRPTGKTPSQDSSLSSGKNRHGPTTHPAIPSDETAHFIHHFIHPEDIWTPYPGEDTLHLGPGSIRYIRECAHNFLQAETENPQQTFDDHCWDPECKAPHILTIPRCSREACGRAIHESCAAESPWYAIGDDDQLYCHAACKLIANSLGKHKNHEPPEDAHKPEDTKLNNRLIRFVTNRNEHMTTTYGKKYQKELSKYSNRELHDRLTSCLWYRAQHEDKHPYGALDEWLRIPPAKLFERYDKLKDLERLEAVKLKELAQLEAMEMERLEAVRVKDLEQLKAMELEQHEDLTQGVPPDPPKAPPTADPPPEGDPSPPPSHNEECRSGEEDL